jgi:hypothetical protein
MGIDFVYTKRGQFLAFYHHNNKLSVNQVHTVCYDSKHESEKNRRQYYEDYGRPAIDQKNE